MTLPDSGLHEGIDEAAYHGDSRSLSSTGAKTIVSDGADVYAWRREHPEHKDAFDFGSVVHALVLGVGDYAVIDVDSWRTKAAREAQEAAREAGQTPILAKDYERALAVRDAVYANPTAAAVLSEGAPEISAWATDPDTGVLMRGRIDWLRENAIVDLKTSAKPTHPAQWERTAWDYRYGLQAWWYSRILELNGEPERPFIWITATTSGPHRVYLHQPSPELIEKGREQGERALAIYANALETGHWPGLADPHEIHTTTPPAWAK